ncbi:hypothetical protein ACFIOY_27230 [Bradyrhizobium sp. TZ2]
MKTVWIYVGYRNRSATVTISKVFKLDLADEWFVVNDPDGVVFEFEVIGGVDDETGSGRQRHR